MLDEEVIAYVGQDSLAPELGSKDMGSWEGGGLHAPFIGLQGR